MLGACIGLAGLAAIVAGCGTTPSSSVDTSSSDGGTTVTYALAPGALANYIFPFDNGNEFSVYNVNDFQYLLYRPLYWFGKGTSPFLNQGLSLALPPVYKGHQVTIRLKPGWKWSNGEPVDAQDVIFWLNMMKAEAVPFRQGHNLVSNWGGFVPGGIPTDITDIHATSTYDVQMTIKGPYSQTWFTDNELSQITPMPMAWDVSGPGNPSNCVGGSISDCRAVYNYLNRQANDTATYGSSPIWSVVDGPWRVQSLTTSDELTLVINDKYSGKLPPHHITRFIELPFTSEQAEYDELQDPTGSQAIDVGYLPTVDAPPPSGSGVGANPDSLTGYHLTQLYVWMLTYFPYNFNNKVAGPIFDQLYFRQAFQDLVDQEGIIDGPLHGYGKVTIGPVADYPPTKYLSPKLASAGDQWPLSISNAENLLRSHGWSASSSGGADVCTRAGTAGDDCGPGIKAGTKLDLRLMYATGVDWMESAAKELASNAALAGIDLTVTGRPFSTVITDVSSDPSAWEMAFWGSWTYAPDYLPTGDELFMNGAVANFGGYDNTENDILTQKTLQTSGTAFYNAMYAWENYLADQLPVVYEPDTPELIETIKGLDIGVQNSALTITPEDWHWQK